MFGRIFADLCVLAESDQNHIEANDDTLSVGLGAIDR